MGNTQQTGQQVDPVGAPAEPVAEPRALNASWPTDPDNPNVVRGGDSD